MHARFEVSSSESSLVVENRRNEKIRCTSFVGQYLATTADSKPVGEVVTIDVLPDDVLLEIFDRCVDPFGARPLDSLPPRFGPMTEMGEAWQSLVHVCRRWRRVVFGSRRRLNLQLLCGAKTPARDTLDVWPALPLFIRGDGLPIESADNIIAALERSDRVSHITLTGVTNPYLEKVLAAMQEPFPELTHLMLLPYRSQAVTGFPDSFLGRSAPRLRYFELDRIPFPGLPKLLLSATRLATLYLFNIPHPGYISPEAMVTALSTLTSLQFLRLEFQSPLSRPDQASQHIPPQTRFVLPALRYVWFKGVSEYLEDLVANIDAPRLHRLTISFFNQIVFDTPQLAQFIGRTPTFHTFKKAYVDFGHRIASVKLSLPGDWITVEISCQEFGWQISSLEQVCTSSLPPLSTLEDLYINGVPHLQLERPDDIDSSLWLELFRPLASVKNLYLSQRSARRIVPALQELVGGITTEVFPNLRNIFLGGLEPGPIQEGIGQFVAVRQLTSHPITIARWED